MISVNTKIRVALLLAGILAPLLSPAQPVEKIHDAGPASNRVNLVYIGDGYTQPEIESDYAPKVNNLVEYMFDASVVTFPYWRYQKFINVYRIDLISPVSGINNGNTPLEGESGCTSVANQMCQVNWVNTNNIIDAALAPLNVTDHWRVVMLNGSGRAATHYPLSGTLCVLFGDEGWVLLHEGGHGFHRLGDEYSEGLGRYNGGEPGWPNLTIDSTGKKWERWLGYENDVDMNVGKIGVFEGGMLYDYGIYRPSDRNMMNASGQYGHHVVGVEKIILDIHEIVDPVDEALDNSSTVTNPDAIWVKLVDPEVLLVDWYVDDKLVSENGGEEFIPADHGFGAGAYEVRAHIYDEVVKHANTDNGNPHPLDLVRRSLNGLQKEITWTVELNGAGIGDKVPAGKSSKLKILGINSASIELQLPGKGEYVIEVYSLDGRKIQRAASGYAHDRQVSVGWEGKRYSRGICLIRVSQGRHRAWKRWAEVVP